MVRVPLSPGLSLSIVFAAAFMSFGIHMPFLPLWLADAGLSATDIAIVLGITLTQRIITLPVMTALANRLPNLAVAIAAYALVSAGLVLLFPLGSGLAALTAISVVTAIPWMTLLPLLDALAVREAQAGRIDYGKVRLWGSIGFTVATVVSGVLIDRFGVFLVIPLCAATLVLTALTSVVLPRQTAVRAGAASPPLGAGLRILVSVPGLAIVLAGIALVQGTHAYVNVFGSVHFARLGYSETVIGLLWGVSVLGEIAVFLAGAALLRRLGLALTLTIGAVAAVLRWGVFALDPGLPALIAGQLSHGLTFAALHAATIHLLGLALPPSHATTAQGVYYTLLGITNGLLYFLSGPLYREIAGQGYGVMAVIAAVGTLVIVVGAPRLTASLKRQPHRAESGG